MMTQGVISAPLSERILHRGAVGYGWINAGWAFGAFTSMFYASWFIRRNGAHRSVTLTMCVIATALLVLPEIPWIIVAVSHLLCHGIGARRRRHRHLVGNDGDGAEVFHGTSAEHLLLSGQRAADLHRAASQARWPIATACVSASTSSQQCISVPPSPRGGQLQKSVSAPQEDAAD